MDRKKLKIGSIAALLIILLAVFIFISLGMGKVNLFNISKDISLTILFSIRLPRVILAVAVGAALAVSGVVLQSLLNNPLADSYTLGISSGAAFGACVAIYLNTALKTSLPVQVMAIAFSIAVLVLVLRIARTRERVSTANLILAGIIVSSTCQAGISFLKSMANENAVAMIYWLMGSLASKNIYQSTILSAIAAIGIAVCFKYSRELNIMTLGRRESLLVGVNYDRLYKILLITCTVTTAACVSLCGIIGFVGLIVPHLTRLLVGADNRKVIPISSLLGAILLLGADTLSRSLLKNELPVGVITTMLGGPFFCYIFMRRNKRV